MNTLLELERLRVDLEALDMRLADPTWVALASLAQIEQARARRLDLLRKREELEQMQAPPAGLPALQAGLWRPLPLYEDSGERPLVVDPPKPQAAVGSRERILEAAIREQNPGPLIELAEEADAATLRLVASALDGMGRWRGKTRGRHVGRIAEPRTAPRIVPVIRPSAAAPHLSDGLSDRERRLLAILMGLAPANQPPRPANAILDAMDEATEGAITAETAREALVLLAHPQLRSHPLIELTGLTGLHRRGRERFEAVRMSPLGEAFLKGNLSFPNLLINGSGESFPAHNAVEIFDLALSLVDVHTPPTTDWLMDCRRLLRSGAADFVDGGEIHEVTARKLACSGTAALAHRASIEVATQDATGGSRVRISGLGWALTADELTSRIQELIREGSLHGVTNVDTFNEGAESGVELELEHLAFGGQVSRILRRSGALEFEWHAGLVAIDRSGASKTFSLADLVWDFVCARRSYYTGRRSPAAETLVVALTLLPEIQDVLRAAETDAQAIEALTTFMTQEARHKLSDLPLPLAHSYEKGFTREQAASVVAQRRLAYRSREDALRAWQNSIQDEADLTEAVSAELVAGRARFHRPRSSSLKFWSTL